MNNNYYPNAILYDYDRDSKTILVLMTLYMSSVLLFTADAGLNVISQILFIIAFGSCAGYMILHGKGFRYDPFLALFLSFIFFCFIALMWARDIDSSIAMIVTLLQLFAMSFVLYSYISAYENIDSFIKALLVSGIIGCYIVIGYYGISEYIDLMLQGYRLGGAIANVNTIGLYASTTVIVCFYYAYTRKKILVYAVMLLPLLVAFGTGSRKALLMIFLGILIIIFMDYRERITLVGFFRFLVMLLIVIAVIYWISTMPVFNVVFSRFEEMLGGEGQKQDLSTIIRVKMMEYGWESFKADPFFGFGIGNSHVLTMERLHYHTYLHNNFIELLASVGVFGFLIYHSMYVYLIINLYKLAVRGGDDRATLMLALILCHLILSYGFVSYYDKMTYIYFSMAAATINIGKTNMLREAEEAEYEEYQEDF